MSQPHSTFSYFLVHSQYTILYSTMVSVMGYLEKQISIQMPSIQNMQIIIQFSLLLGFPKNVSCTLYLTYDYKWDTLRSQVMYIYCSPSTYHLREPFEISEYSARAYSPWPKAYPNQVFCLNIQNILSCTHNSPRAGSLISQGGKVELYQPQK